MTLRIKHNRKAYRDLLKGPEVQKDIQSRVDAICDAAGDGYECAVNDAPTRARGAVWTATAKAMKSNAKDNTLIEALGHGA
jgi:hypothetical protein